MTFVVFDYGEALTFFSAERRPHLTEFQARHVCLLRDVVHVSINVDDVEEKVKHELRLKTATGFETIALLAYDAFIDPAEDVPLYQLFDERVVRVLINARAAADAPIATRLDDVASRLDGVMGRLDALPPCGAGIDYVAAEARAAVTGSYTVKRARR